MVREALFDKTLFLAVFLLIITGITFIYSATFSSGIISGGDSFYYLKRHILWLIVAFIFGFIAYLVPIDFWKKYAYHIFIISIVLLILVLLFPVHVESTSAKRWLGFGFFRFQPSEFAKFALILFLAKFLTKKDEDFYGKLESYIPIGAAVGVMGFLVFIEPHKGAAIFLFLLTILIMFSSKFSLKHIVRFLIFSSPLIILAIIYALQSPYVRRRIEGFIDPVQTRTDSGYQAFQAILAFVKGGFWGEGIGNGTQKLRYLPEIHTDYIFALIGEETGFFGVIFVITLFLIILYRGIRISLEKNDEFTQILGIGITYLISLQALFHMLVNVSLMPSTGFTLPFISYGGSSLVMYMVYFGILLRISKEPNKSQFKRRLYG